MIQEQAIDFVTFEKRAEHNFLNGDNGQSAAMIYVNKHLRKGAWTPGTLLNYSVCKLDIFIATDFDVIIGEHVYHPTYGDICLLGPGELHYGSIPHDQEVEYYEFLFSKNAFESICGGSDLVRCFTERPYYTRNMFRLNDENTDKIITLCENCKSVIFSGNQPSYAKAYSYLIRILHLINSCYDILDLAVTAEHLPAIVSNGIQFINKKFAEIQGNEEIASYTHVSVSYLTRMFKRTLGCTPYHYLIMRRLANASQLLKQGASVTEACYNSGFGDCSNFIEKFNHYIGMTPNKYRAQYIKQK